jgi:hypothetical protein
MKFFSKTFALRPKRIYANAFIRGKNKKFFLSESPEFICGVPFSITAFCLLNGSYEYPVNSGTRSGSWVAKN